MKKLLALFTIFMLFATQALAVDTKAKRISLDDAGNYYSSDNVESALQEVQTDIAAIDLSGYVPTSRTVNGHALSSNVTVTPTDLSLVIGTNVQAYDADLTTYAGITPSANIQSFLGSADYSAARTNLGLAIGTNVQAYDADLTTYAGITPSANVQSFLGAADYSAMRTQLTLVPGTDVQTQDAELSALAGLTSAADKIPYFTGSGTAGLVTIGSGLSFSSGTLSASGGIAGSTGSTANAILTANGTGGTTVQASGSSIDSNNNILIANGSAGTSATNTIVIPTGTAPASSPAGVMQAYSVAGSGSGQDDYTQLMLHMDGANGSTTFTDSSQNGFTMTRTGSPTISTTQSVFGSASGRFPGGARIVSPSSTNFNPGTGDFSIDYRARFDNWGGNHDGMLDIGSGYASGIVFQRNWTGHFYIYINNSLVITYDWSGTIQNNTWYHIALERSGTSLKLYIDGVNVASATNSSNISTSTYGVTVGANYGGGNSMLGYIDEVRYDVGIARHSADFTPPASAYSQVINTHLKLRNELGTEFTLSRFAKADGSTTGLSSFTAADFNSTSSGLISLDYTNGQVATTSVPGFLSAADWTTFNAKGSGDVTTVGNCTTGDCFSGTSGNILTFADDVRDGTIEYHDDNYFLFRSDGLNDADSTFQPTAVFQPYETNSAGKVIVKFYNGAYPIRLQADGGVGPSLTGQNSGAGVGFIFDTYGGIVPATVADGTDTSSVTVNNNGIDFGGASYRWANIYSVLGNFSGDVTVPDSAYASGWNGSATAPTKNAVYDKIETIAVGSVQLVIFDTTTDVTTGDGAIYFKIPSKYNGMNLTGVSAQVITAGTTGTTDVQLARCAVTTSGNICSGTVDDMLTTKVTIDSDENSSASAATAAVINTSNDDVATNQIIRVDVDATSTTNAKGLSLILDFTLP